jgi:hypothetical protein
MLEEDEENFAFTASAMFLAGSDTVSFLLSFGSSLFQADGIYYADGDYSIHPFCTFGTIP